MKSARSNQVLVFNLIRENRPQCEQTIIRQSYKEIHSFHRSCFPVSTCFQMHTRGQKISVKYLQCRMKGESGVINTNNQ